jgi:hypothetical protein
MSTSSSPNKGFWRALGLVIGGLTVGILALALLVTASGPRVRNVAVQNQTGERISSVSQGLTVVFDRPIVGSDFKSAIEFDPEVEYTVSHRQGQLSITFDQNLLSNTEYALTIKPDIEDEAGRSMEGEYRYEFTTAEPSFTYLERNYDRGAVDKIIQRAPLSGESQILFGEDRIKSFARNGRYLAVVVLRPDNTDELRVFDLETLEERSLDIPANMRVDNLRFSPTDNQFVFIPRAFGVDADDPDSETYTYNNKLYRYDIDGDQLQPVDTSSDKGNVERALYSRDGQALLYKTINGSYYLTGATQTTETTPLGIYNDSGGFDRTNSKIAFQFASGATIYDAQAKETQELSQIGSGGSISAPTFLHNSEELMYLWDPLNEKAGTKTKVYVASADGEVEEQVVESQPEERFLDYPVISYDDRYVLVEATSEPSNSRFDDYVGNRQPKDARLVLYDRFDHKEVESDNHGIAPVWNR